VLAGGTDLLVKMKQKIFEPEHLIALGRIEGLRYIKEDGKKIRIGALTRLQEIAESEVVRQKIPVLAEAASKVGSVQIRHRGTLGGNVCNASPAADTVPPLICLEATAVIMGKSGERELPVEEFFVGPGKVNLHPGEIVTEIVVPIPNGNHKGVYLKLGRRKAMDISIVGVGGLGCFEKGRFESIRIALASVAATPIRAKRAEEILKKQRVDSGRVLLAANEAVSECQPISDVRGSASYREQMVKVLVEQAIRSIM
jgi:carbon-monoxide dehydrogenase medium subunit